MAGERCGSTFLLKHRVPLSELWVVSSKEEAACQHEEEEEVFGLKCRHSLILIWPTNLCVVTFRSQELKEVWLSLILRQRRGAQETMVTRLTSLRFLMKVVILYGPPYYPELQRQREAVRRAVARARARAQRRRQPPVPKPGEGREHAEGHTELHTEEPLERVVLVHATGQQGAPLDTPCSPLSARGEAGRDVATQTDPGELQVSAFGAELEPIVEELVEDTMEKAVQDMKAEEEDLAKLQPLELAGVAIPYAERAEAQSLQEGEQQPTEGKVQNRDAGEASAAEVPVQLAGERVTPCEGLGHTEAAVVAVPGTPAGEEATPALDSPGQVWAKGVPGEAAQGSSAKKGESPRSTAAEEPVGAEEELVASSSAGQVPREETEGEWLVERAQGGGDSGTPEAVSSGECSSHAVQQSLLPVPEEGPGSGSTGAGTGEAPRVPVPVLPAALEEPVAAEAVAVTDSAAETSEPLAAGHGQMAAEEVPATTVCWVL